MNIVTAVVCFGILIGFSSAFSPRQLIGTCVEECSLVDSSIAACPTGYVCRSNGCGHVCQKFISLLRCPLLMCADIACIGGFAVDANGCPTCRCRLELQ